MAQLLLEKDVFLTCFLTYAISLECLLECKIYPQHISENFYQSFKWYRDFLGILRKIQ